ncbi:hypothetical protein ACN0ZQ_27935, partial [Klebsiella pneumoniae]|uniref:hypothetical protein n=1 Tax=Klebsiella pneumoniae TaxID=573 RepID=UPI003AD15C77
MPVQVIFRFLVQAVRSSLRCGTPQPDLRRAVPALSKTISLPDFVKGERSECHLPLTTLRIKQAWQWWGV